MKKVTRLLLLLLVCSFLFAGNAMALSYGDGGVALQGVLDGITVSGTSSVDVTTDYIEDNYDSLWGITGSGTSAVTFIIELASFAGVNTFGVYDATDHSKTVQIFNGAAGAGSKTALTFDGDGSVKVGFIDSGVDFAGNNFGYYLQRGTTIFYSDTSLNADSVDHMAAFQGTGDEVQLPNTLGSGPWTPNEYVLAWEDVFGGGDRDYTDMVLMVESVENTIPEPTTMVLFGFGLLGMAGVVRRKN